MLRPGSYFFGRSYPYAYNNREYPRPFDCSVHKKFMANHIVSQGG